jgi:hypothetical protein
MPDYRVILKKVGLALVIFGLADIAFMIYCFTHGQSYSSSFNIFAVIAGVFLLRGHLGAAKLVTTFSAFMLGAFIGSILFVFPFTMPIGLLLAHVKQSPVLTITLCLFVPIVLIFLGWVYRELRSAPVLEAFSASGKPIGAPKLAFGIGLAIAVFLAVMLTITINGAAGDKAVELARQKLGPNYSYSTQSIQFGGGHGRAMVAAYNDSEIKYVPVEWNE